MHIGGGRWNIRWNRTKFCKQSALCFNLLHLIKYILQHKRRLYPDRLMSRGIIIINLTKLQIQRNFQWHSAIFIY